jgi:hypothetical protein
MAAEGQDWWRSDGAHNFMLERTAGSHSLARPLNMAFAA